MSSMSSTGSSRSDYGHKTMEDVKSDAAAVRKDLAALKNDVVDVGSQAAQHASERIKHGTETASDAVKSAGEQIQSAHTSVCKKVSAHPTAAILVSLGLGAVLGRMMWR